MQTPMIFKALLLLSFTMILAAESRAQESAPDVVESAESPSRVQLYSETYSSPFATSPVNFQRASADLKTLESLGSYKFFIAAERYSDANSTNGVAEFGLYKAHSDHLFSIFSIRREYLNDPAETAWVARGGLIYSRFFDFDVPHTFADTYAETFLRLPDNNPAAMTFSGWAKYGYRLISTDHWSFDPFMVMARIFDNTDTSVLGADYESLNFGPQMTYYAPHPDFSVNLIFTRSFTNSFAAPNQIVNQYWLLLAIGANF